ncbi:MAG: GNAT family N-acetyltransferase [Treponema sp.]|nr:GNAT family N-acetyltransferase [Treponema sp.]
MKLQGANVNDTQQIMALIEQAKKFLASRGVDQWQDGYPQEADILNDLKTGKGYVIKDGQTVIAYCCIDFNGERAYDTLNGSWLNDEPYIVIHRIAVDDAVKGQGVASALFHEAEVFALAHNIKNIRIDTDNDNAIMKHILEKFDYTYCGTIWFANSVKIAYHKVL